MLIMLNEAFHRVVREQVGRVFHFEVQAGRGLGHLESEIVVPAAAEVYFNFLRRGAAYRRHGTPRLFQEKHHLEDRGMAHRTCRLQLLDELLKRKFGMFERIEDHSAHVMRVLS